MEKQLKIVIASDMAGYELKNEMFKRLSKKGYDITDFGCNSSQEGIYTAYAQKLATAVANNEFDRGILICGTGQGVNIVANKVDGIQSALIYTEFAAIMCREHNDAHIMATGAWLVTPDQCERIIETYLFGKYSGGRHVERIEAIRRIEKGEKVY